MGLVDDQDVEALVVAVAGDEGGVLGEDLVEGLLLVLLDGGVDGGLPLGALDHLEEVAVEVSDDELAFVGLVGDAVFEACGQELVEAEEQDAVAGARHALGGFDGEEGLACACPAVDEDARGVVEDVEDDALLLGELVELLADVVEEGVGGGDEVEVASEVVGDGVDGLGLERGAFVAGLGGAGVLGEAVDVAREGVGGVAGVVDEVAVPSGP